MSPKPANTKSRTTSRTTRLVAAPTLALAGLLLLGACSSSSSESTEAVAVSAVSAVSADSAATSADSAASAIAATWGGRVDGTDAFVALASNGSEIMAYVCDGDTIATWFKAADGSDGSDLAAGNVTATSGQLKLTAKLSTDALTGNIVLADGSSHEFTGTRLSGDAGLYRSEEPMDGKDGVGGWVVLEDGQLRGAFLSPNAALVGLSALRSSARLLGPDTPY